MDGWPYLQWSLATRVECSIAREEYSYVHTITDLCMCVCVLLCTAGNHIAILVQRACDVCCVSRKI